MEKPGVSFFFQACVCMCVRECTYKYLCVYICVQEEGRSGKGTWEKKREPIEARRDRLLRHSCNFPVVSRLVNSRWNMRRGAWCGQHAAALPCSPLTHTLVHSPPPPFTPSIGAAVARGLSLPRHGRRFNVSQRGAKYPELALSVPSPSRILQVLLDS